MCDRDDSSFLEERDHLLRRAFTWRFQKPEDVEALTRVCEMLHEWVYESNQSGPGEGEDIVIAPFRAAGEDILSVAELLRATACSRFGDSLAPEDCRRCERAERWAEQAKALGETILASLEAE